MRGVKESLYSKEGVTQGDPLSMLVYALSTVPLIEKLESTGVTQCWYADDSSAQGSLDSLKEWWDQLNQEGPGYGYSPQGSKTYLVVHPEDIDDAHGMFQGTGIKVVTGNRFLGGYIGQPNDKQDFVKKKVKGWIQQVEQLSEVGKVQPQSAHAAFCKSMQFKWQYLQRVVDSEEDAYNPLKMTLRNMFIPAIVGGPVSPEECDLFSLPVNKAGLALTDPVVGAVVSYAVSKDGSLELISAIHDRRPVDVGLHLSKGIEAKRRMKDHRTEKEDKLLNDTLIKMPIERKRAIERSVAKRSGSKTSGWLSVVPLRKHNYDLSPSEFRDALSVRYKRTPIDLPASCDGCAARPFSIEHALSCKTGGLITRRHNEVRDLLGEVMAMAWGNCVKEPIIAEASEQSAGLKGDLACRGVWEPQREALFDVRVTDTDAPSYVSRPVAAVFAAAEEEKKRKYMAACEERRASFTPLVCSVDAHFAPQMACFVKVVAERLSDRWDRPQGVVRGWLRARIAFAILRAASMCIHGARKRWRSSEELIGFYDGAAAQIN